MKKSISTLLLFIGIACCQLSFAQVTQQATYQFNGKGDFSDNYKTIRLDNAGNMLVAGYTVNARQHRDILLQKLSTTSNFALWTKVIQGSANSIDEAVALTIDAANNIYLTAFQTNQNTGKDILTQKYSANGNLLWSVLYNFSDNLDDVPTGIYLDNNGKVIVVGTSVSTTKKDIVLIQYAGTDGTTQWTKRWNNASANLDDEAVSAVISSTNEITLLGTTANVTDTDILMAKYDGTGAFLWSQTIDKGANDRAADIVIDAADNTYLTASIYQAPTWNVLITKYNAGGFLEWEQILNYIQDDFAVKIGLDGSNNSYVLSKSDVAAGSPISYDALVSKWDAGGVPIWTEPWNSPLNKSDLPSDMKVLPSGQFVVVGTTQTSNNNSDIFTVQMNANGGLMWESVYDGSNSTNDGGSTVAVAGNDVFTVGYLGDADNQSDAVLIKNTNSAALQYFFSFQGGGDNNDGINAHTYLDSTNQLFVTGYTITPAGNKDIWAAKMNNATNAPVWATVLSGKNTAEEDEGVGIVLDNQADVYVAAKTKNSYGTNTIALIKYKNNNGDTLWTRYFTGAANLNDEPVSLQIDAQNNIYLAGTTRVSAEHNDFLLLKYGVNGTLQWAQTFNGSNNTDDKLTKMIAYNGYIYLVGASRNTSNNLRNISLLKYDGTGNIVWQKNYGVATEDENVTDLFIDAAENVYFTGSLNNGTDLDFLTVKYDNTGLQKWVKSYDSGNQDEAVGVVADDNGNVTVAGTSLQTTAGVLSEDMITLQYSATGGQKWIKAYNGNQNKADIADKITIDKYGNLYVLGHSDNSTTSTPDFDFTALRFAPDSTLQWSDNVVVSDSLDQPKGIFVKNGYLFLMGDVWGNAEENNAFILKYAFTGALSAENPLQYGNAQVFPNPFQESFFMSLPTPQADTEVHLLNTLGQEMPIEITRYGFDYQIHTNHLASGVYFYQVKQQQQIIATGKVIKQ